tara:strand:- start:529 stop:951 length:423 start_codon:yes stop_codon:yes gene_type:complete
MKPTKQLIERNLKFNQKYTYLGLTRGSIESGMLCSCDNCGKLITNMVQVGNNETREKFTIGTDCAETLSKAKCLFNNGSQTDYQMDIYSYNLVSRFVTELNKGKLYTHEGIKISVIKDNDKKIYCFEHNLKEFYPQYVQA